MIKILQVLGWLWKKKKRLVLAIFSVVAILSNHSTKAGAKIEILSELTIGLLNFLFTL